MIKGIPILKSLCASLKDLSGSNVAEFLAKFFLCLGIVFIASCSFEKELPVVCVSGDKKVTSELCREYRKEGLEEGKTEVLKTYGFNKRDARSIYTQTTENSVRCKSAVVKQCDLIMLRNGVGY